jgi:hypothetical protein
MAVTPTAYNGPLFTLTRLTVILPGTHALAPEMVIECRRVETSWIRSAQLRDTNWSAWRRGDNAQLGGVADGWGPQRRSSTRNRS